MEVNSLPSATKYINDTFIYPQDISRYTNGHVLKLYLEEKKKICSTARILHKKYSDVEYCNVYNAARKTQRLYNKIISKIKLPTSAENLKKLCTTPFTPVSSVVTTPSTELTTSSSDTETSFSMPPKKKLKKYFWGKGMIYINEHFKYDEASTVKCQGHVLQLLVRNNRDVKKTLSTIVEDIGVSNVNTDSLGKWIHRCEENYRKMSRSLATESAVKRFHEFCQKPLTLVYNEDTNQAVIQKPSTLDNQETAEPSIVEALITHDMPNTTSLSEVTTRNYGPETIISILRSIVAHYSDRIVKLKREKKTLLRALRRKRDGEKQKEVIQGGASTAAERPVLREHQVGTPSKKRRRLITPTPSKDRAAAYLEECHSFDIEQVTRDLSLTNGNIWHYLANHYFRVHELTSLLLPCFTDNVNRDTKTVMYSHIIGLAHSFKYLRRHLSTELQWSDFKRKCGEPFQCPATICFSSHPGSSAVTSSDAIASTSTEPLLTTPKKESRRLSLLSNPVRTRNQKIRNMAQDARLIASQKDLEMNIWKLKYEALYHATKSMRETTSSVNCRCSEEEFPIMGVEPNLTESVLCTTSTSTDRADVPMPILEEIVADVPMSMEGSYADVSIVEEAGGDVSMPIVDEPHGDFERPVEEQADADVLIVEEPHPDVPMPIEVPDGDVPQTVVFSDCSYVKFSVEHLADHNYSEIEDSKHAIPIINIIPTITCYPENNNQTIKSEPHEMSNSFEADLQSAASSDLVHNLTEGFEVDNDIQCTIHTEIVHGNDSDIGSELVEVPGELDCKPEIVDNVDNVVIQGDVNIETSVQHNDTVE